jgi:hypothetical protein
VAHKATQIKDHLTPPLQKHCAFDSALTICTGSRARIMQPEPCGNMYTRRVLPWMAANSL